MAARSTPNPVTGLHPLNAILLAFPFPLFLGAMLSDVAYRASFHVQWSNFAAWLIAGGLLVGTFALLWALVDLLGRRADRRPALIVYFALLLVMWGLGLVNALVHARDAWATMPEGLYLSAATAILAFAASWIGYSRSRDR